MKLFRDIPSLCKYSTRSQMALDIPLRKTNTWQKSLSFLGLKLCSKINPNIKNATHRFLLGLLLRKIFYFICKPELIQIITTFLRSILPFNFFIATLIFLVIVNILLSCSSYFNLVFPPTFFINSWGTLMKISTSWSFFRLSPPSEI